MKKKYISPSMEVIETKAEALLAEVSGTNTGDAPDGNGPAGAGVGGSTGSWGGSNKAPRRSSSLWSDDDE